jgi:EamA domain-containing membrane protein RarD|tara:strand:+ start:4735 stop:4905 length:171 start_codon:yes stop_codon:yes gene_type:complete
MKKEVIDSIQVLTANGSAIGLNMLTNINEILTLCSLILAIGFTIYKFSKGGKEKKN